MGLSIFFKLLLLSLLAYNDGFKTTAKINGIRIKNNKFVDILTDEVVTLRGVSHSSGEYRW